MASCTDFVKLLKVVHANKAVYEIGNKSSQQSKLFIKYDAL